MQNRLKEIIISIQKDNNEKDYNELYNLTSPILLRSVQTKFNTTDINLIEESLQNTYIKIFKYLDKVMEHPNILGWMKTIATNESINLLIKEGRIQKGESLKTVDFSTVFESNGAEGDVSLLDKEEFKKYNNKQMNEEIHNLINEIIDKIPQEDRLPLMLSVIDGYSYSEIAKQLNISEATVGRRIKSAKETLKQEVSNLENKGIKLYTSSVPALLMTYIYLNQKTLIQSLPLETILNPQTASIEPVSKFSKMIQWSKASLTHKIIVATSVVTLGVTGTVGAIELTKPKEVVYNIVLDDTTLGINIDEPEDILLPMGEEETYINSILNSISLSTEDGTVEIPYTLHKHEKLSSKYIVLDQDALNEYVNKTQSLEELVTLMIDKYNLNKQDYLNTITYTIELDDTIDNISEDSKLNFDISYISVYTDSFEGLSTLSDSYKFDYGSTLNIKTDTIEVPNNSTLELVNIDNIDTNKPGEYDVQARIILNDIVIATKDIKVVVDEKPVEKVVQNTKPANSNDSNKKPAENKPNNTTREKTAFELAEEKYNKIIEHESYYETVFVDPYTGSTIQVNSEKN